jgi:iron complex transport system permease protein
MKIVIDVDKLLAEGRITSEEHVRLKALSVEETGSLGFNILIGFGVIATAGGALALLPSGPTAIVLGLALSVAGLFLSANHVKEWGLLGSLLLLVGSLTAAGGILYLTDGGFPGFLIVTILCLVAAWLPRAACLPRWRCCRWPLPWGP